MAKDCYLCKNKTIFYVWSTSRDFPIEKLIEYKNLKSKYEVAEVSREGQTICFKCLEELKNK